MLETIRIFIIIAGVTLGGILFATNSVVTGPVIIFFASMHVLVTGCIDWKRKSKLYPVFLFVLSFIGTFLCFYLFFSTL